MVLVSGRNPERRMGIGEHVVELRRRLTRAALAIVLGVVAGWFVAEPVFTLLRDPVMAAARNQNRVIMMNFSSISAAFDLRIEVALIAGFVVSSPFWLYQVAAFIIPALNPRERRYIYGFTVTALPLFVAGCAAGLWVMPHIVQVMTGFAPVATSSYLDADGYFDFVLKLTVVTGVAFIIPLLIVVLNMAGLVSGHTITRAWRWAVLAICLFTALATPAADVMSMLLLAVPMLALYLSACAVALLNDKRRARRLEATLADPITTGS